MRVPFLAMALMLAACGGSTETPAEDPGDSTTGDETSTESGGDDTGTSPSDSGMMSDGPCALTSCPSGCVDLKTDPLN